MTWSAPLAYDQCQEEVEAMMRLGAAFSDVEDVIDASELSTEHKAALWLLAWSLRDIDQQRSPVVGYRPGRARDADNAGRPGSRPSSPMA